MIVNVEGIVLSKRGLGEFDRICTLFTDRLGKISARFIGVNRATGKLRALSEPLCRGEYRLHISARSGSTKVIGGRLQECFPTLRTSYPLLLDGQACCELLERLTPEHAASPEAYALLCSALSALDSRPHGWIVPSFGLCLAEILGISLRERPLPMPTNIWEHLHRRDQTECSDLNYDAGAAERITRLLEEHLTAHAGRQLRSLEARREWKNFDREGAMVR